MDTLIAACGLDCGQCEAYTATQANDLVQMEEIAAKWRVEYNAPSITIVEVTCDGCMVGERHGGYCSMCEIRKCSLERGLANCAYCPDYACGQLHAFFAQAPVVKDNLERIRQGIA